MKISTRIIFIDDDPASRRQWLEWSQLKGYGAKAFESVFEANQHHADVYVFDISACCPGQMDFSRAYSPICRLMEDHPGADIIIGSAMSRNAVEDALSEIETMSGKRPKFFDASYGFEGLEAAIKML